jgi:superfamily II DNA or RNA helicase
MLTITPVDGVAGLLIDELQFKRVEPIFGWEAQQSGRNVNIETVLLHEYRQAENSIITFAGFLDRVYHLLKNDGHNPILSEVNPQETFEPIFSAISGIELRGAQTNMLATACSCDRAQFNGVTGMGKSVLITQLCRLYPYSDFRIVICAQQRPVVASLYRAIHKYFPEHSGQVGGGKNDPNRITVSTAKSLLKIPDPAKVNLLMYDEVHTAAGRDVSEKLMNFVNARMYGLSASTECRTDKADKLIEAIFGPVRVTTDMQEGQIEGYIPPVEAYFYKVYVPSLQSGTPTQRRRDGIWENQPRNYAVTAIAKSWENTIEDPQILIMTNSLEHVLRLRNLLPDYDIIYASSSAKQLKKFKTAGIIDDSFEPLSDKMREKKIREFECGILRKVISTTTLGTGVDAPGLDVIIRADGGSSEISNIQFRGRVMRGATGIYCDIMDYGDKSMEAKANKRLASAKSAGWPVKVREVPYE